MKKRAGATGLEPAASGLTGQRDNQLRHAPVELNVPAMHAQCQGMDMTVRAAAASHGVYRGGPAAAGRIDSRACRVVTFPVDT